MKRLAAVLVVAALFVLCWFGPEAWETRGEWLPVFQGLANGW